MVKVRFFLRSSSLCFALAPSPSILSIALTWYSDSSIIQPRSVSSDSRRWFSDAQRKYLDNMVFGIFSTTREKRRLPGSKSLERLCSRRVAIMLTRMSANFSSSWLTSLLERFNFLYIFEIILKLSSFSSKSTFQCIFCLFVGNFGESFEIPFAFPSRELFNRIILYLAGSSVSSTMLSIVHQKYSNLALSPLNFGSVILSKFLSTRLTGNSCVFFGLEAFSSSKSISDEAEPIDGAFFVR